MLPLSLFKPWILFVNHIQFALASDDLAIGASFFYGCFNFHFRFCLVRDSMHRVSTMHCVATCLSFCWETQCVASLLFVSKYNPSFCQIIGRHFKSYPVSGQDADVMHSHLTRNMCQHFMTIFQLHSKHCIG